jgi:nitrogen fixation protein FixH
MKPFIAGLFALFIFAMASGIYVAYRDAEGLVENDYYRKQNDWFMEKTEERQLGLEVQKPTSLMRGSNEMTFVLTEHGKPLERADVHLFVGRVSTSAQDLAIPMHETTPGVYTARMVIPASGKWLVRLDLATTNLSTRRLWFYDVN